VQEKLKEEKMGGTCNTRWRAEKFVLNLAAKPEGNILLGRPWCRWNYGIKCILKKYGGMV
jgi:hypothetical protein